MIEIIKFLYNQIIQIFLIFTIIPNIERAPVLNWLKKNHWHIIQPKYVFFKNNFYAQSRGVRIIYNRVLFSSNCCYKNCQIPSLPHPSKKISTYLSTLSWINYSIFRKKPTYLFFQYILLILQYFYNTADSVCFIM